MEFLQAATGRQGFVAPKKSARPTFKKQTAFACLRTRSAGKSADAAQKSVQATEEAALATKLVAEGGLFFELIREYSKDIMLEDLKIVFDWGRKYNYSDELYDNNKKNEQMEEAAKKYANALYPSGGQQVDEETDRLNKARRHVTHYFLNISDLVQGGYVKKSFAKRICDAIATDVLKRDLYLENALIDKLGELDKKNSAKIKDSKKNIKDAFNWLITLSNNKAWARGCNLSKSY